MGPVDYIENPDQAAALSPDLSENLQLHLPELAAPTLGDLLGDRLEAASTPTSGTSDFGPVDVADASNEARRFFED
ncbi:hypothetical protein [Arthrobacter sp. B0490]|uniref:hypothetical protein n=1 Tax=Arthrobacter sp. B0490 TaxID=2058891 RepID=UPI000CE49CF0|nr:hypothetical protein [Arthrobacter sp. B0490]